MKKKINISIVGTGLMGLQHIKAIQKSKKANLHSIVEIGYNAKNLSKYINGPKVYFKRDELNHTGAHKINNCLGQILLAKKNGQNKNYC